MSKVISAFFGCGKTTATLKLKDKKRILDLDASLFYNNNFPKNYIDCLKENIDKYDIIFVSSHEIIRGEMNKNNIEYILYYPDISRKNEIIELYKQSGNNERFLKFINNNFDNFIESIENDKYSKLKIKLKDECDFILNDNFFKKILTNE